jgi:hypothetical protein
MAFPLLPQLQSPLQRLQAARRHRAQRNTLPLLRLMDSAQRQSATGCLQPPTHPRHSLARKRMRSHGAQSLVRLDMLSISVLHPPRSTAISSRRQQVRFISRPLQAATAITFPSESIMVHVRAEIASGSPSAATVSYARVEGINLAASDIDTNPSGGRMRYLRIVYTPTFSSGSSPAILVSGEYIGDPASGQMLPVRTTVSNT